MDVRCQMFIVFHSNKAAQTCLDHGGCPCLSGTVRHDTRCVRYASSGPSAAGFGFSSSTFPSNLLSPSSHHQTVTPRVQTTKSTQLTLFSSSLPPCPQQNQSRNPLHEANNHHPLLSTRANSNSSRTNFPKFLPSACTTCKLNPRI